MADDDPNVTGSFNLAQTNDIAMDIDEVLNDKAEVIKVLTNNTRERMLLVKDLLMNAYVRGFFAGMQHTLADLNAQQEEHEEEERRQGDRRQGDHRRN